ncbi:MAG: hypothetical protein U5K27_02630 [Desulfotignum sp.]|nr:hypothetical protein [Desulfotignum sp.]
MKDYIAFIEEMVAKGGPISDIYEFSDWLTQVHQETINDTSGTKMILICCGKWKNHFPY